MGINRYDCPSNDQREISGFFIIFNSIYRYNPIEMTKKHNLTFGERLADYVAYGMGSWKFIIIQTMVVGLWITINLCGILWKWDPYPFILLNLLFSTQAAYAAPIIMMSQNRQSERDREHAEADYQVNLQTKKDIEEILIKLSEMELDKLDKIMEELKQLKK